MSIKTIKAVLLLIALAVSVSNCTKDDAAALGQTSYTSTEANYNSSLVSKEDIPDIMKHLDSRTYGSMKIGVSNSSILLEMNSNARTDITDASILTQKVVQVQNEQNTRYTFLVENPINDGSVINLIVTETSNTIHEQFIRFTPTNELPGDYLGTPGGQIEYFDSSGQITGEITISDQGIEVITPPSNPCPPPSNGDSNNDPPNNGNPTNNGGSQGGNDNAPNDDYASGGGTPPTGGGGGSDNAPQLCTVDVYYAPCSVGGNADGHDPAEQDNGSSCSGSPIDYWVIDCSGSGSAYRNDFNRQSPEPCDGGLAVISPDAFFTNHLDLFEIDFNLAPGDIIDINQYLSCFTSASTSATFDVTIYADQPIPNQNDTWKNDGSLLNPDINVGHTFISIRMDDAGTTLTQVFGFYPQDGVTPLNPSIAGVWVDDGNHDFDTSASIQINSNEMNNLISFIQTIGTPTYNLNSLNCTDIGLQIGNQLGMNIPDTIGTWPGGSGSNPGNMGQDIRAGVSNSNVVVNLAGGTAPLSFGSCN